jgi:hypothetical protein
MAVADQARIQLTEQIDAINGEIDALALSPDEAHMILYYLTGADPRAMRDALRFIRDRRLQNAMRASWKNCPAADRWPTHLQHHRGCRTCRKD